MAKTKKRVLSLVLSLAMLLTLLPATALAEGTTIGGGNGKNTYTLSTDSTPGVSVAYEYNYYDWVLFEDWYWDLKETYTGELQRGDSVTAGYDSSCLSQYRKILFKIRVPNGFTAGGTFEHDAAAAERYKTYSNITEDGFIGEFLYTLRDANNNVTFTITANPITYSVKYDAAGGTGAPVDAGAYFHSDYQAGKNVITVASNVPQWENHTFRGWKLQGTDAVFQAGATINVNDYWANSAVVGDCNDKTGEFVLVAQWKEKPVVEEYTVSFDLNYEGAVNTIPEQKVTEGALAQEPVPAPEREGFVFTGWYKEASAENLYSFSEPVIGSMTLYAGWSEETPETAKSSIRVYMDADTQADFDALKGELAKEVRIYSAKYALTGGYRCLAPWEGYWWTTNLLKGVTQEDITQIVLAKDKVADPSDKIVIPAGGDDTYAVAYENVDNYLKITITKKQQPVGPVNEGGANDYAVVADPDPTDPDATTQGSATIKVYRDGQYVEGQDITVQFAGGSADVSFAAANGVPGAIGTDYILSSIACVRTGGETEMTINANGSGSVEKLKNGEVLYLFYSTTFTVDGVVQVTGKDGKTYNIPFSQVPALQSLTQQRYVMDYAGRQGAAAIFDPIDGTYDSNLQGVSTTGAYSIQTPVIPVKNLSEVQWNGETFQLNTVKDQDVSLAGYTGTYNSFWLKMHEYVREDLDYSYESAITTAVDNGYKFFFTINATEKVEIVNFHGGFDIDPDSSWTSDERIAVQDSFNNITPNYNLEIPKGTDTTMTFKALDGYVITGYSELAKGNKISVLDPVTGKGMSEFPYTSDGTDISVITEKGIVDILVYQAKDADGDGVPDYKQFTVTWKNYDGTVLEVDKNVTAGTMPQYNGLTPVKPADMYYVYTFAGWTPELAPVSGNVEYTAVFTSTYIPPYIPPVNPPVDIEDPDVPLADLPGLNTKDHYAYIAGYPDGTVQPNGNITRAEVATIFFRLFTEEYRNTFWSVSAPFTDVEATDWFNTEVATVASAGVVAGYPDGTFLPNNNITRAEFATIAARFLTEEYVGPDLFTDVSGHWAQEYINRAANAGWINGYPDGSFHPDAYITRAEAMTLVNNMLGRMPHEDHLLYGMKLWVDNPSTMWYYEAVQEATNGHDYDWAEDNSYEIWTSLTPDPDWEALEALWTSQNA